MRIAKIEGVQHEKDKLDDIFKRLEVKELNDASESCTLPLDVFILCDVSEDEGTLISRKWGEPLCSVMEIFKYQDEAIERDKYYQLVGCETLDDRYQQYLDYLMERKVLTGNTDSIISNEITKTDIETITTLFKEKASKVLIPIKEVKKKKIYSEGENEDDETIEETESGEIIRADEIISLDDEFDDTQGNIPDDYIIDDETLPEEKNDEWGF